MTPNETAKFVVNAAVDIHRKLGPGLLESVYRIVLAHELNKHGFRVDREVPIPVIWDGIRIELGYRADLIVNEHLLLELKSLEVLAPVHKKQTLTYLKLTDMRLGLLLNFGSVLMKDGIHRIVNDLDESEE